MNLEQNGADKSRAMTAIDALLEDKSDAFKVAVLQLCRQIGWADDDPGLLLAIATHQLEALVKQYPDQIEAVMNAASAKLEANWQQVQAKLIAQSIDSTQTAHQIDNHLHEAKAFIRDELDKVEKLLAAEREGIKQVIKAEQETLRQEAGTQTELLTRVYEGQCADLKAQTEHLATRTVAYAQVTAKELVEQAMKDVRKKHYVEAIIIACGCATALMLTSWTTAWVSRGRAEDNTRWADIERWNQRELQACTEARLPTCNFHIRMPEEKGG